MSYAVQEARVDDQADEVLQVIESGNRDALKAWIVARSQDELAWLVLALGNAYLGAEAERDRLIVSNAVLQRETETLDNANSELFRERAELTRRLEESREIRDAQAEKLGEYRRRLVAHGERIN